MPLVPHARLQLVVNGWRAYEGPVPGEPLRVPLRQFEQQQRLIIELKTSPITRFPGDPRDWEKKNAITARLTLLGEKLLGLRPWP